MSEVGIGMYCTRCKTETLHEADGEDWRCLVCMDGHVCAGLTHAQVLALDVTPARQLVEDIIEAGSLGTIAGLPETHKSWLASEVTHTVAVGGKVLGRFPVLATGPVGYVWQDDSQANEVERIRQYATRHGHTGPLPIRWYLNNGYTLPADIEALRDEVVRHGFVLLVLDSLYNLLPGVKLKDEDVAGVFARLKADLCDPTGCTVLVVDHAPWPTDGNQGQRRGYGSVFKAAAIRFGIYIDRAGDTLFIEARGNNIAGLKRTAMIWNHDRLALQLVEPPETEEGDSLADRIVEFLARNPGATTTVVQAAIKGKEARIKDVLDTDARIVSVPPVLFGKPSNAKCWALATQLPDLLNTTSAQERAQGGRTLPELTDVSSAEALATPVGSGGRADVGSQPPPPDVADDGSA